MAREGVARSVAVTMPAARSTSTIHIGRLAGVPIGIQPLWLLIVAFITFALGDLQRRARRRACAATRAAGRVRSR